MDKIEIAPQVGAKNYAHMNVRAETLYRADIIRRQRTNTPRYYAEKRTKRNKIPHSMEERGI